ncbi:silent information regulator family protein [Pelomyxa schiedti]|nr:silent information regulator family protein [Pelomyxa schiedti]
MQGFAVTPKRDCPHVARAFRREAMPESIQYGAPCAACGDTNENWICATCFEQNCSRYVKGHAARHFEQTHHPVGLSFADMSFWCYECDSYIEHRSLRPLGNIARDAKFSTPPPMAAEVTVPSTTTPSGCKLTVLRERNKELTIADCTLPDALLFNNCKHCVVSLPSGELVELAASHCEQCMITVAARLQRGILHIHGCSDARFVLHNNVPTVVLEDSLSVDVSVPADWASPCVFVVKCCKNVRILVGSTVHAIPAKVNNGGFAFQLASGSLVEKTVEDYETANGAITKLVMDANAPDDTPPVKTTPVTPTPTSTTTTTTPTATTTPTDSAAAPPGGKTGYGHSTEEEITEFFDKPAVFQTKMEQLISLIRASSYIVVYTGAGISTSARIPDYRGPQGVWTMRDRGEHAKMDITLEEAKPTKAHMAMSELVTRGVIKYVVSTNVDGLHRRSGIPADKISELHGNCYIEHCKKCKTEYQRTFDVGNTKNTELYAYDPHATGRLCSKPGCDGYLIDSIINFGESLPVVTTQLALAESRKADLALVLGTSMRVHPACDMPPLARQLVICNLQKTPFDNDCVLRVFEKTDAIMEAIMTALAIPIPEFNSS